MANQSNQYWIWGLLDYKSENKINALRNQLYKVICSPQFPTHLTLTGPLNLNLKEINDSLVSFLSQNLITQLPLDNLGLDWNNYEYRFLYLKVGQKQLYHLKESLDAYFNIEPQNFLPHISLAYSREFKLDRKQLLFNNHNQDISELSLSRICIAVVNEKERTWKIYKEFSLY